MKKYTPPEDPIPMSKGEKYLFLLPIAGIVITIVTALILLF